MHLVSSPGHTSYFFLLTKDELN